MFGLACGNCWDRDCSCTPEELAAYEERKKNRPISEGKEIVYSTTLPVVRDGDIIVLLDGVQLLVKGIKDGFPYAHSIKMMESGPYQYGQTAKVIEKYKKIDLQVNMHRESPFPIEEIEQRIGTLKYNTIFNQFEELFSNMPDELAKLKAAECMEIAEEFACSFAEHTFKHGLYMSDSKRWSKRQLAGELKTTKQLVEDFYRAQDKR